MVISTSKYRELSGLRVYGQIFGRVPDQRSRSDSSARSRRPSAASRRSPPPSPERSRTEAVSVLSLRRQARGDALGAPEVVIGEWVRGSGDIPRRGRSMHSTGTTRSSSSMSSGSSAARTGTTSSSSSPGFDAPTVAVLHTVLERPSPNQRRIVEELGVLARQDRRPERRRSRSAARSARYRSRQVR